MAERPGGWGRSVAPSHEFRLLLHRFMIGGHRENPFTEQFVRLVMHQIAGEARHLGAGLLGLQPEHQDRFVGTAITVRFGCYLLVKSGERLVDQFTPSMLAFETVEFILQINHQTPL